MAFIANTAQLVEGGNHRFIDQKAVLHKLIIVNKANVEAYNHRVMTIGLSENAVVNDQATTCLSSMITKEQE